MKKLTKAEETLLQIKDSIPFLSKLSDKEILLILTDIKFKKYNKFEIIFEQGSDTEEAFIVVKGKVNISIGEVQQIGLLKRFTNFKTVTNLGVKSVFGEMSAITGEKRSARATSYELGTMLISFRIDDEITEENSRVFIKLYKELIDILSNKIRQTNVVALKKNK